MQYRVRFKAKNESDVIGGLNDNYPALGKPAEVECSFYIEDLKEVPQVGEKVSFDFPIFFTEDSKVISVYGEVTGITKRYIEPEGDVVTKCIVWCEITVSFLKESKVMFWHSRGKDFLEALKARP